MKPSDKTEKPNTVFAHAFSKPDSQPKSSFGNTDIDASKLIFMKDQPKKENTLFKNETPIRKTDPQDHTPSPHQSQMDDYGIESTDVPKKVVEIAKPAETSQSMFGAKPAETKPVGGNTFEKKPTAQFGKPAEGEGGGLFGNKTITKTKTNMDFVTSK